MSTVVRMTVAIISGFLAMTIIVFVGAFSATTLLVTGGVETMARADAPLPALYLIANLGIALTAAVFGGWVASWLDKPGGWRPVFGLTLLVLLMSVTNQAVPIGAGGAPVWWYPYAILVLSVAGTLLGGWIRRHGMGHAVATV